MMKVDKEKCIGCGACVSLCPNTFDMKDGKSVVISDTDCDEALTACPVGAIVQVE
ncbi:MAG: ferredoxin [Nanoarchaeota archaeon]|nr:ferredoxin [Nanoarchaeota archaeon]